LGEGIQITIPGRLEALPELLDFVDRACASVHEEAAFAMRLAVEEACTNIMKHGYAGADGPIRLAMSIEHDRIVAVLCDEAPTFDPDSATPPDLDSGWEERRIGGLGWHLIRQMTDEVHHESGAGRGNRLTLVKRLPNC
jgi:serine/threonine-protein kinase RsbW